MKTQLPLARIIGLCLYITIFLAYCSVQVHAAEKILIQGKLVSQNDQGIKNARITLVQGDMKIEQSTNTKGEFEFSVNPGTTKISYLAPGYAKTEDNLTLEAGEADSVDIKKRLSQESIGGWWTLLLLVPGVAGLLIAWGKEKISQQHEKSSSIPDRLLVALLNGVVWAGVLVSVWYFTTTQGITRIRLFHSSLSFEFFVPLLGYFGALLYVFDLFRGDTDDKFREKEFGMRIIMGPYIAIVMVSLFGKNLEFINLDSSTGQGTLAFFSGLIVVVAIQGLIERANETLGQWRRHHNPHKFSPLAEKFKLTEKEDKALLKLSLRFPKQLLVWSDDALRNAAGTADINANLLLAMKWEVQAEQLKQEISDLIWDRLKMVNATTIESFAALAEEELEKLARKKPELSTGRLKELRQRTADFLKQNGIPQPSAASGP
jgi:hypothetical protein